MRSRAAVLIIALVLLSGCGSAAYRYHPGTDAVAAAWSSLEEEILALVNRQRALHHLPALRPDARLHRAAVLHCREMAANRYLGHNSPDGRDFGQRAGEQGYRWQRIAENVALLVPAGEQGDLARRVMFGTDRLDRLRAYARRQGLPVPRTWAGVGRGWGARAWDGWQRWQRGRGGWMGSSGHRRNILLASVSDIGVGHVGRGDGRGRVHHYVAAEFAAPFHWERQ